MAFHNPYPCLFSAPHCTHPFHNTHTHTHIHTHAHTHIHTHAHTHMHTRTHTHLHTRTYTAALESNNKKTWHISASSPDTSCERQAQDTSCEWQAQDAGLFCGAVQLSAMLFGAVAHLWAAAQWAAALPDPRIEHTNFMLVLLDLPYNRFLTHAIALTWSTPVAIHLATQMHSNTHRHIGKHTHTHIPSPQSWVGSHDPALHPRPWWCVPIAALSAPSGPCVLLLRRFHLKSTHQWFLCRLTQ